MVDLPQHAGQIALLRDMLLGQSPWADQFRINLFTPYLLGYGLALPLSLVIPIATVLKILLSLAYLAFVFVCFKLRQHFDVDERLDWLAIPGFFGFAYHWGFFTFLLAAPIGLWFILMAERFSQRQSAGRAVTLTLLGLVLLVSHGLVFLFALGVGGLTMLLRLKQVNSLTQAAAPFMLLTLACLAYFLINRQINASLQTDLASVTSWNGGLTRIPKALIYTLTADFSGRQVILWGIAMLTLLALPWILGLRPRWRGNAGLIPLAVLIAIFLLVPSNAAGTVFMYQRFGLYLLPAYSWMFSDSPKNEGKFLTLPMLIVLSWTILGAHSMTAWRFGQESAGVTRIIDNLSPGRRALMIIFDTDSPSAGSRVYTHYGAWYQAEKQGLVDFNFAWFPPQIVRYRANRLPAVQPGFEWHPKRFDWVKHHGSDYRYFLVRSAKRLPEGLFNGADCAPELVEESGEWRVFEYRGCL